MTTKTKEQLITPVVASVQSNGLVQPKVVSEEALQVLNKKPIPTVWGQSLGLPIYDRLPGISQAYKLEAGPDSAYVYLSPNFPKREGPGSLQPGRLDANFSFFVMESGEITWSQGQVNVGRLEVDITTLGRGGLPDGQYKAGYLMDYAQPESPSNAFATVENSVLADADVGFASARSVVDHPDYFAISENVGDAWWAADDAGAGVYADGAWYTLDFKEAIHPEVVKFVGQPGERATANMAVYYSDDAIIWDKFNQIKPVDETWTFQNASSTDKHRYWRFFFWGGYVTVGNILFTGEALFPDNRRIGPVSSAVPFIDNLFEEITDVHLLVATFTVQSGKIVSIVDQRRFLQRKYEPVAQWLSSFQDVMLKCYFEDVEKYASLYMAPPTADYHFYQELDTNACSGAGVIDIGEWEGGESIAFPDIVDLQYDVSSGTSYTEPSLYVGQTTSTLDTDPDPGQLLETNGTTRLLVGGSTGITPQMIDFVADPVLDSDLATKVWTDANFQTGRDIDNGIY